MPQYRQVPREVPVPVQVPVQVPRHIQVPRYVDVRWVLFPSRDWQCASVGLPEDVKYSVKSVQMALCVMPL